MKKITFKRLTAFLISGSLSVMNIPVGNAAGKNNIPGKESEENGFQEIRMISVEGETSEYGDRPVRFVDENGSEIVQNLVPEISAGGTFAFYSLSSLTPSKYDLREQDQLPAVRNQHDTSTCWAHAALAASETNLIKKGLADTSIDLSESHLVWFGNCSASTDTGDTLYNEGWNYGISGYDDVGSYSVNAAGVLARGSGIEFESNAPSITDRPVLPESQRYVSHGYIQNSDFLDNNDQTNIKKHIMNTGALMVSYYSKDSLYYDETNFSYYDPNSDATNHAVNIVGWDDNFSRYNFGDYVPEGDGAWICRNSWGESYGDGGYFYLSYYDASIGGITSFEIGQEGKYDGIYQYDGLAYSAVGYSSAGIAAGNIFTANQNETVTAAGFYTQEASVPYNISVYTDLKNSGIPTSGTLAASQDGTAKFAGYHAIDLETPVPVSEGQSFSVVVTLKKNGAYFYCDNCGDDIGCTYYTSYNVSSGRTGSSWSDSAVKYEQNLCIKALTSRGTAIDAEHFPDGSFRDYITANIDKDSDGFLSENEISAVTEIDVDATGIANLQGIEYFTELVSLSCGNNSIISLDISKNKKLSVLSCENNLRNLGEPSCGAWVTLGIDTDKISDLNGAEIKNGVIIPNDTEITYNFDCGNNFTARFTILADTSHSYQISASDDPLCHSFICSVCGDEYTAAHSYGEWLSTEENTYVRICSECGYRELTTSADHNFGLWTDNGDGTHSRNCSDCEITETTSHVLTSWTDNGDGTCSRKCAGCGYEETLEHSFGGYEISDSETHSLICGLCGHKDDFPHQFGEYKDNGDDHIRICSDCEAVAASPHNYSEWSVSPDEKDNHVCTDCGHIETSEHKYGQYVIVDENTHSQTCENCGDVKTSGHLSDELSDNGDGTHKIGCSACGYKYNEAHIFGKYTDNGDGTHSRSCTICGNTEISEHIYGKLTDDGSGTHSRTCADCGSTETSGHSFGKWLDDGSGTHSRTCADCGSTETSGHSFGKWLDNGSGTHSRTCADCGSTETSGHAFGEWETDITGFRIRKCEICGFTETEKIEFIRGDLSGDDIIDAFDMVLLRRALIVSFDNKSALPASDINNDGKFSIADLVSLQRYLLGYPN